MTYYLDPRGRTTFGIGICGRCSKKVFLDELFSDPNSPGLMVCREDLDKLDPYRLPARQTERISLDFVRPDLSLTGFAEPVDVISLFLCTETLIPISTQSGDRLLVQVAL